jgi:hypothetical protein
MNWLLIGGAMLIAGLLVGARRWLNERDRKRRQAARELRAAIRLHGPCRATDGHSCILAADGHVEHVCRCAVRWHLRVGNSNA